MDGVTWFKPEYKLFKGQQRRRPNLGFKTGKMAPRFCYKVFILLIFCLLNTFQAHIDLLFLL